MARSRRRRGGSRRVRNKLDWVQNGFGYSFQQYTIPAGTLFAIPLVYSNQTTVGWTNVDAATGPQQQSMAAFPRTEEQPIIRAVRGQIWIYPEGAWIAANVRTGAFRLVPQVMDPMDGDAIVAPDYTMLEELNIGALPYVFADEQFMWERRFRLTFRSDVPQPVLNWNVNWSGRRRLQPDEGLYMMIQNTAETGNYFCRLWLRTLVELPGT